MTDPTSAPEGFSLKRWSRRKHDAARAETADAPPAPDAAVAAASVPSAAVTPVVPDATAVAASDGPALPPIESLTHDSDFSAFMQPKVEESLKRAALKKLFTDPHFNVMDGLDIYVGDYTQVDPMPEGMLEKLGKVYGMAKEAVAGGDVAPDGSTVAAGEMVMTGPAVDTESASPAPATEDQRDPSADAGSGTSQPLPATDAPVTLPLAVPEPPANLPAPAALAVTR